MEGRQVVRHWPLSLPFCLTFDATLPGQSELGRVWTMNSAIRDYFLITARWSDVLVGFAGEVSAVVCATVADEFSGILVAH